MCKPVFYASIQNMERIEAIHSRIADIIKDIGLIFFASLFVGPIATGNMDLNYMVWGLVASIAAWQTSIILTVKTLK